jgi:pyrimidine deaminase RibD-like protein
LGRGRSDYQQDAVRAAIADAGIEATPLREWVVSWPSNRALREALAESTLYVTLEPSSQRHGEALPPTTQLIEQSGIPRVVIGCPDPVPERAAVGAATLHSAGLVVRMGIEQEECEHLIEQYAELANSKLQVQARNHARRLGRVSK